MELYNANKPTDNVINVLPGEVNTVFKPVCIFPNTKNVLTKNTNVNPPKITPEMKQFIKETVVGIIFFSLIVGFGVAIIYAREMN